MTAIATDDETLNKMSNAVEVNHDAQHLAESWARNGRYPYSRVLYADGIRVKVTVEQFVTKDDTQPIKAQK